MTEAGVDKVKFINKLFEKKIEISLDCWKENFKTAERAHSAWSFVMKINKIKFVFTIATMAAVTFAAPLAQKAFAGSNGSVKSRIVGITQGSYKAYLFRTGDRSPSQIKPFRGDGRLPLTVTFNNVATGSRYFVRVVDEACVTGGQSSDGELKSGTLNLPDTKVSDSWTSGCP